MGKGLLYRLLVCIVSLALLFALYINAQNDLTELRIRIPQLTREVRDIEEENTRLRYQIDEFENPLKLLELSRDDRFSHMRFPSPDEVLALETQDPL